MEVDAAIQDERAVNLISAQVLVPPSRGSGGAWKVVNEDGFGASVEITLALAQTTRNRALT